MRFNLAPVLSAVLLASTVAASGASISASLGRITSKALALNHIVASWKGDIFGVIPILTASSALTDAIENGTAVAKASKPLSQDEAFGIVGPASTLVDDTTSVLKTLVAAKPKFDALLIGSPLVLQILKTDRKDAKDLTTAVTAKVPAELQSVAQSITAPIDTAFANAIKKYSSGGF
ncbi:hydrophobic surface binding protein A-domain-containing protein [Leptodontidium sp. MPI-SDFR-AT-0119]|nr:hydrophobic surface binding protein A-domain-containing protein [Leptodontidium sp. MPI-SDFR-AT-0119]